MNKLVVSVSQQMLYLFEDFQVVFEASVSTALKGVGCQKNSHQTPIGRHIVRAKIGQDEPLNTVFVGRRTTGETYSPQLGLAFPERDWILTRILWLSGTEKGVNRLGQVDTMQRFVYIHGTPDTEPMGIALSQGCVRMRNADLVKLFDLVPVGCEVVIEA